MHFDAYRFITGVVSPYISSDEIYQLTQVPSLDWEAVASIAGSHSIVQALYPVILEKELEHLIPDDFLSYVKHLYELNCKRNEMMKAQLVDAVLAINRLGIKPLLMKGAAHLFLDTFSNIGDRLLTDLDILVPTDEVERVCARLITVGYEYSGDYMEFVHAHHHYPPLIKQGECAMIELHRHLVRRTYQDVFPTKRAWENSVDIALPNKAEAKVLTPAYRIFHSFLHSSVVDRLHRKGYVEVRQLHELARTQFVYSPSIDWDEMFAYADEHEVDRQLHANLYAASKFMHIPDLKEAANKHIMRSTCHHARVCSKLKYNWFEYVDRKLFRLKRRLGYIS